MLFTIVNAVPLFSGGAFTATKVENRGESGITDIPQMKRSPMSIVGEFNCQMIGEIKQHVPEINRAILAII